MRILAIETSCDETAVSLVEGRKEKEDFSFRILSSVVHSQVEKHRKYGGVFPSLAKREHGRNLIPVLKSALLDAGEKDAPNAGEVLLAEREEELKEIFSHEAELFEAFMKEIPRIPHPRLDAIAVTEGPGLEPALWVGINFARALSRVWSVPIIPANHMEGHIVSALMHGNDFRFPDIRFPALALLVSGGHTELIRIRAWGQYEKMGETRDDAAGEAFDKAARILGLPYPGGPEIARLALRGKETKDPLPRPMLRTDDFDFSFSGLKTAVLYRVRGKTLTEKEKADIAHEFQRAVVDVLVEKTVRAAKEIGARDILLGGGVAANALLRASLAEAARAEKMRIHLPDPEYTGDNAAMIGTAAAVRFFAEGESAFRAPAARGALSIPRTMHQS